MEEKAARILDVCNVSVNESRNDFGKLFSRWLGQKIGTCTAPRTAQQKIFA